MKPFRKNLAITIDGGGIRGIIPAKALTMLEAELGVPIFKYMRLSAGTSTGSIIAAGLASGIPAADLLTMYMQLGNTLFKKSFSYWLWLLRGYRYSHQPLVDYFSPMLKGKTMGDLWNTKPPTALVVTTFDMVSNETRFLKSWKPQNQNWTVLNAVLASAAAPTYLPVIDGRYSDGGIGSYNNPCFIAAYEFTKYLGWKEKDTTLISFGTGRAHNHVKVGEPSRYSVLKWLPTVIETHAQDAADQQALLVHDLYPNLDFRRVQVELTQPFAIDDPKKDDVLLKYGEEMGRKLLNDEYDFPPKAKSIRGPKKSPAATKSTSRRQTSKSGSPKK